MNATRFRKRKVINGVNLPLDSNNYLKGSTFGKNRKKYNEIIINDQVLRVNLQNKCSRSLHNGVFFVNGNTSFNNIFETPKRKSILKFNRDLGETPKSVTFDEIVTITPISPRKTCDSSSEDETLTPDICGFLYKDTPVKKISFHRKDNIIIPNFKNGELKISLPKSNKKLNSSCITISKKAKMTTEEEAKPTEEIKKDNTNNETDKEATKTETEVQDENKNSKDATSAENVIKIEILTDANDALKQDEYLEPKKLVKYVEHQKVEYIRIDEPPKRKRGRPRKTHPDPDPPFSPFNNSAKKKTYLPQKRPAVTDPNEPKRKRGRPRKKIEFGFHNISSDINSISLPSDMWSAHVSVTYKRSQVCFTRVVQAVSDSVPVECDRSVKFIGGKNYYVKMNNRLVELVGAPKTVESLKEVEILLEIVNDLNINDPVLRYYVR